MSADQPGLTGVLAEIRALREEVRQLRAMLPAAQVRYYPPAGAADHGFATYAVDASGCQPAPYKVPTSVAAGCAPVQIYGVLP